MNDRLPDPDLKKSATEILDQNPIHTEITHITLMTRVRTLDEKITACFEDHINRKLIDFKKANTPPNVIENWIKNAYAKISGLLAKVDEYLELRERSRTLFRSAINQKLAVYYEHSDGIYRPKRPIENNHEDYNARTYIIIVQDEYQNEVKLPDGVDPERKRLKFGELPTPTLYAEQFSVTKAYILQSKEFRPESL